MSASWLWVLLPMLPVCSIFVIDHRRYLAYWLWLTATPALLLALMPPDAQPVTFWWYEARWGAADPVARAWLAATAFVWACAALFAVHSRGFERRQVRFWSFWQLAFSGNLLLIIAQDVVSFYLGFSIMSIAAYGLIVHNRGPLPRRAGRIYLQLAILGEMLLFVGIVLLVDAADGQIRFDQIHGTPLTPTIVLLLLLGFGLKAGFWPLHVWLPLAHPAAPAPASAVLSGAMIKAGILGLWRLLPAGDPLLLDWSVLLLLTGCISALYGVALGLLCTKAKSVLAFSSVSQMGYALVIVALAWHLPAHQGALSVLLILFVVHHALAKGALFLSAGLATAGRITRGGWLLVALPALTLAGFPLSSGAVIKAQLKYGLADTTFHYAAALLAAGSCGTALLLARAITLMYRSNAKTLHQSLPYGLLLPWSLLCLSSGVLPILWPRMREYWLEGMTLSEIWAALWPLLLAVCTLMIARKCRWQWPERLQHLPNPGLIISLRLKRFQHRPLLPRLQPSMDRQCWRARERRWNRFWQKDIISSSAWLLCLLLLLAWLW